MTEHKTWMAVGGHVGDMELTCGGVLATRALMGDRIITVALTGGEKGNPPHLSVADYRRQKEDEARAFAEKLHGEAVVFPYADGELPDNDEVRFRLADLIRLYRPSVLLTHWKNSIHKDHSAAHRIVNDAQFYAALPGFTRDLPPHYAAGPYYAENWEDPFEFIPSVYVEVSPEGFALWREAIALHWFTVHSTSFQYREYYTHLMSVRGIEARRQYAQAFDQPAMSKRSVVTGL
ncbi:MAG: PIG-L family deacetylase [Clostridiaceae bacterium]|nr:PIG-L family deacetylase [Clostridiaceae bacterium]